MRKISVFLLMLTIACTKKDEPMVISDPVIELKYDGKNQYTLKQGAETIDNSLIQWKSSDAQIGTIDQKGLFKGRKVGKTEVTAYTDKGSVKASVEIVPYFSTFTEPSVDFGQTKQSIKAKEKRKLLSETENTLLYEGENSKVEFVLYSFENNKMTVCGPVFVTSSTIVKEVGTFLLERYPLAGSVDGNVIFLHDSKTYGIFLTVIDDYGLAAIYTAYDATKKRTNGKENSFDSFINTYKAIKSKAL
ncbi:Ig-like domain-containing protein [Emticicia agri]|uniref:BIG2 domain-containing protein n=1 Tax=Emticicia agri TaxID=2492393 RepID=A0A4Q5LU51_9BACT|nr:Ig-like domain-containing protein [Emticicia agri]RYU93206.1 hypothetical protein EWM59_23310 [Emticicia agri]